MDAKKTGAFIAELRREKNLTQEALGAKLGVTNKTISRWENGNYLPDISLLPILSKELNISINELLSGEKLDSNNFRDEAENNITLSLEFIRILKKRKALYDFFEGAGIGILCSALYNPDTIRKIIIIIIALFLICTGWLLKKKTESLFMVQNVQK